MVQVLTYTVRDREIVCTHATPPTQTVTQTQTEMQTETLRETDTDSALSSLDHEQVLKQLDTLGAQSAEAQELKSAITTVEKLLLSVPVSVPVSAKNTEGKNVFACGDEKESFNLLDGHILLMIVDKEKRQIIETEIETTETDEAKVNSESINCLGFLKYGHKDLFFYTPKGKMVKVERCLCLLDFYVTEQHQRRGLGKLLFDEFLHNTLADPGKVAYDRPSKKLLPFLHKQYGLTGGDLQPNRYTIFPSKFF